LLDLWFGSSTGSLSRAKPRDKLTILSLCFDFAQHPELIEGSKDRA
jgi:hypothetical protein